MRLSAFLLLVPVLMPAATAFSLFDDVDTYGVQKFQEMLDTLTFLTENSIIKRDDESALQALFTVVGNSGIVQDTLYMIARDDNQINGLVNLTTSIIKGGSANIAGFNVSLNTSELLNTVMSSGIIEGTAAGLLLNKTNLDIVTNFTCNLLASHVYIPKVLVNLGNGDDLTVEMIADTVKYTPNLNPKYNTSLQDNSNSKQAVLAAREKALDEEVPELDDELFSKANEGSAQLFFNNIIQSVLDSEVLNSSLSDILVALNRSNTLAPIIIDVLQNDTIKSMFPKLISGLYKNGVFDGLDLQSYFSHAKETNLLSDGLQALLTNPTWEPPVGYLLNTCDATGGYKDIQIALYGVKK